MSSPEVPAASLAAAMAAAWPGLPAGMTMEEAERRTRKALQAAYLHMVGGTSHLTHVHVDFAGGRGIELDLPSIPRVGETVTWGEGQWTVASVSWDLDTPAPSVRLMLDEAPEVGV